VPPSLANYFWIAIGSALGGVLRYWLSVVLALRFGEQFPIGTLVVNVTGSFLIGFVATSTQPEGRLEAGLLARNFLMTGICGGYTTFSAFSLQTLNLIRGGQMAYASANVLLSVLLCLVAVWLGHWAAQVVNR
jgi:CrcB protein